MLVGADYDSCNTMEKFRNKYCIDSARWKDWDYGANAAYFITICCLDRQHFFGYIENGSMHLNGAGIIAHQSWTEIPNHFQNVCLDEFIIMPNHMHGIIIIDKPDDVSPGVNVPFVETRHALSPPPGNETGHALSLQRNNQPHPRFRNQGKNTISAMIGSFKSSVTRQVRPINPDFGWQSRFHDHIIRSRDGHHHITHYILQNPLLWKDDQFFS